MKDNLQTELFEFVHRIPVGKVMAYGQLGELLSRPVSGKLVGAWLYRCPQGVPWWRVVSKSGSFPVGKVDPYLQKLQVDLLKEEGAPLLDHQVNMALAQFFPDRE